MIRKPTNLLLTTCLKRSLVDLTGDESDVQLAFSQVNRTFLLKSKFDPHFLFFSLYKFV